MKGKIWLIVAAVCIACLWIFIDIGLKGQRKQVDDEVTDYAEQLKEQLESKTETFETGTEDESELQSLDIDLKGYEFNIEDTKDISTYIDSDIDHAMEVDRNTVKRAVEFNYQYNENVVIDDILFSESINALYLIDSDCHKVLLSVLSQYADANDKNYDVFEVDGYYEAFWQEDGLSGLKVHDTDSGETVYVAYASTGFEVTGYVYKVE